MKTEYTIAEITKAVLLLVNAYKHESLARLMSTRIKTVISTMVLVMQNLTLS